MKKLLCCVLTVLMVLGMLSGCGSAVPSSDAASSTASAASTAASSSAASAGQETAASPASSAAAEASTADPAAASVQESSDYQFQEISWTGKLQEYRNDDSVNQLIFVECIGTTEKAVLMFFEKSQNSQGCNIFTKTVECDAYIGPNGLGKTKEGDDKTPEGTFDVVTAFGNKDNPGTALPYIEVNEDYYSCDEDCEYYNQIINVKETGHQCTGEHLSDYTPHYNYAMQLNYNPENTPGVGNSIFLHCTGPNHFTGGCIAIDEEYMKYILQHSEPGVKVLIYEMAEP